MKTVELFAGIGGFRIAADNLGLKTVWANDSSDLAAQVYEDRFGKEEFHAGDIRELSDSIPSHELLTAGFPCQPFSSAGKKKGVRDPRGTLFSVVVDVLEKHRPRHFVLENVKRLLTMERGTHFATILSSLAELDYRIEWRLLNALDFGLAQNRQRVVIVGTKQRMNVSHPFVQNNRLRLTLATNDELLQPQSKFSKAKFSAIENWTSIADHGVKFPSWGVAYKGRFFTSDLEYFSEAKKRVYLKSILQKKVDPQFDFTKSTIERMANSEVVNRYVHGVEILCNQGGGARMGYTVFGVNGIAPTLTATTSRHYERYKVNGQYRRLTNVEYARLQGFPDDHCRATSIYSQYGLYGNAIPPPMVEWVLGRLGGTLIPMSEIPNTLHQQELFANA